MTNKVHKTINNEQTSNHQTFHNVAWSEIFKLYLRFEFDKAAINQASNYFADENHFYDDFVYIDDVFCSIDWKRKLVATSSSIPFKDLF